MNASLSRYSERVNDIESSLNIHLIYSQRIKFKCSSYLFSENKVNMSPDPIHRKLYFIMEIPADFRTYNSAAVRKIDRLARNRDHPFGRFVKSSPRANFSRITENFISWLEMCHHRRLQLCAHFILTAADREISCCSWPLDCIRNSPLVEI